MAVLCTGKTVTSRLGLTFGLMAACILILQALIPPAWADGTFLLQLGSYDSDGEANQKWKEIKEKNPGILDNLTLHVAEVALPPDNKVSYRTQAGPLATREQASSLCATLQNRGIDCYVVETALYTGEAIPDQTAQAAAPMGAATVSEPPVATAAAGAYQPGPSIQQAAPQPPIQRQTQEEKPAATTLDPATSAAVPAPVFTASVVDMPQGGVDASASSVSGTIASADSPAQAAMQASAAPADIPPQPALPPTDHMVPGREPKFLALPASMAPAPATQVAAEPTSPPPAAAAPAAPTEKPGFFARLFGSSPDANTSASNASVGNVNVAEAIRVPLSEDKAAAPATVHTPPVAAAALPAVHGLGGAPGSATPKTFWAQLSYFRDEYQARSFYEDFHAAYPQFSDGIRVRITRPYSYATTPGHVSLRVGPFEGTQDVRTICASAVHYHLRCTVIRDLGAPIAAESFMTPRNAHGNLGFAPVTPQTSSNAYWVQLGTYRSNDEAMEEWKMLQQSHHRMLRRMRVSVSTPTQSSAAVALYRLRAGPFKNEAAANRLCESLKKQAAGCVVLSDR